MSLFDIIAVLVCLAALLSYVNARWLELPTTIGLMTMALLLSIVLMVADHHGASVRAPVQGLLDRIDFSRTLMQGLLSFLLFAGALHIELSALRRHRLVIGVLASAGVVVSTAIIGSASYFVLGWLGLGVPLPMCLLFGALISPTDPISVLAILRTANAPEALETQIAGESLFNDGVAVVVFVALLGFAGGHSPTPLGVVTLLLREAGGGVLLGLAAGYVFYRLFKSVNDYQVEILLSLALVLGAFALSMKLHVSGPIAIVVAGLFIGNHGRAFAMSETTRENLDKFWELVDEILNAVLFVMIGLEVFLVRIDRSLLIAGASLSVVSVVARYLSVGAPLSVMRRHILLPRGTVRLLTWGGLRGGISVALALSLPVGPARDVILSVTYFVVVTSVLVQGLTMRRLVQRLMPAPEAEPRPEEPAGGSAS